MHVYVWVCISIIIIEEEVMRRVGEGEERTEII